MEIQTISLPTGASLTAYLHPQSPEMRSAYATSRAALILCHGGGYSMLSDREVVPPAMIFFSMGFQVFVLSYSIGAGAANRTPLEELGRSVQLVRSNSQSWHIDPNRVAVLGFSAGGHLAASLGVHWNDPALLKRCDVHDARQLRPDALILSYPVITDGDKTHAETLQNVSRAHQEPPRYWALERPMSPPRRRPPSSGTPWTTTACRWKTPSCSYRRCTAPVCPANATSICTASTACPSAPARWTADKPPPSPGLPCARPGLNRCLETWADINPSIGGFL